MKNKIIKIGTIERKKTIPELLVDTKNAMNGSISDSYELGVEREYYLKGWDFEFDTPTQMDPYLLVKENELILGWTIAELEEMVSK